ncbi:RNHCP domain-containing protein [Bittarella massiliensis]|uniref:RNHCP domain-containing protein n=1 Tax=Bittarella massiliensis (ex Durand et al. 2017) TaxID=1720313 RepID=UPI00163C7170|nr:RNHCP domain-containing protein [Bittarella massiliensis (ex Durand et al. 2017)]MBC2871103.1 RNHCP domain-containing protein [Bittarella massiliensis (ex Durand et al. 2017)]
MNRENKRRQKDPGYYRTHRCQEVFTCKVCGRQVVPEGAGSSHRNHCPNCLHSLHVDDRPGDRAACCGGIMEPVGVWVRAGGEWAIIHRCRRCGHLSSNRVAADDNPMKLMSIALKPLALPPFPLERVEELTALMGGEGSLKG